MERATSDAGACAQTNQQPLQTDQQPLQTDQQQWLDVAQGIVSATIGAQHQDPPAVEKPAARQQLKLQQRRVAKQQKVRKRLKRLQTTCESREGGKYLVVRTFAPSQPPLGKALADKQVKTRITAVAEGVNVVSTHDVGREFVVEHTVALPHLDHLQ
jgi:hypothetical protein